MPNKELLSTVKHTHPLDKAVYEENRKHLPLDYIPYSSVNMASQTSVGGQTGSMRVSITGIQNLCQLKGSITFCQSKTRKYKTKRDGHYSDHENIGEVLAGIYAQALLQANQSPIILTIYDQGEVQGRKPQTYVASVYLDNPLGNLDDYLLIKHWHNFMINVRHAETKKNNAIECIKHYLLKKAYHSSEFNKLIAFINSISGNKPILAASYPTERDRKYFCLQLSKQASFLQNLYEKAKDNIDVRLFILSAARDKDKGGYAVRQLISKDMKHIRIVDKTAEGIQPKDGEISVNELSQNIRQGLARSIAISALVMDHDVNPGNMIVVGSPYETVARIDYGHAFNDLLFLTPKRKWSSVAGGGISDEYANTPCLDFLNRRTILGLSKAKPKLWRDYPGLVPSVELATALRELAAEANEKIDIASSQALAHFTDLINLQMANKDYQNIELLLRSLREMHLNATGQDSEPLSLESLNFSKDSPESSTIIQNKLKELIDGIGGKVKQVAKDMKRTATLMALQVKVDAFLANDFAEHAPSKEALWQEISDLHIEILKTSRPDKPIIWIRHSHNEAPIKGSLLDYMAIKLKKHNRSLSNILKKYSDLSSKKTGKQHKDEIKQARREKKLELLNSTVPPVIESLLFRDSRRAVREANQLIKTYLKHRKLFERGTLNMRRTLKFVKDICKEVISQAHQQLYRDEGVIEAHTSQDLAELESGLLKLDSGDKSHQFALAKRHFLAMKRKTKTANV